VIPTYQERAGNESIERLSSRQDEVWQLIEDGNTTNEIDAALDLSAMSIEVSRCHCMAALDMRVTIGLG
jgi:DNA-binding CsgD family transcriptional regulator